MVGYGQPIYKVNELKKQIEEHKTMPMPYGIEHDMSAFQGSSIMAIYVQTVASYIFKHISLKVYKAQCDQNVQDYSTYTRCDYD